MVAEKRRTTTTAALFDDEHKQSTVNIKTSIRVFSERTNSKGSRRRGRSDNMKLTVPVLIGVFCLVVVSFFFSTVIIDATRANIKASTKVETQRANSSISIPTGLGISTENIRSIVKKGRVFECGWPKTTLLPHLFPDYESAGIFRSISPHNPNDILVMGMHGPCDISNPNNRQFNGTIVYVNAEPDGDIRNSQNEFTASDWKNVYQLGPYNSAPDWHSIQVYHMAPYLIQNFDPVKWNWMFDTSQKPHNTGKHNALIYVARNCQKHRQSAVKLLSTIVPVHFGGECMVSTPFGRKVNLQNSRDNHPENWRAYSDYKYCISMENTKKSGYITEKILLAFMGGCLPIYYGTVEVLEIFNPKAFIYYNISNPQPAVDEIRYLQTNPAAYEEKLSKEPIFRNVTYAMEEIFSLTDSIGNGKLKQLIRRRLGMDT